MNPFEKSAMITKKLEIEQAKKNSSAIGASGSINRQKNTGLKRRSLSTSEEYQIEQVVDLEKIKADLLKDLSAELRGEMKISMKETFTEIFQDELRSLKMTSQQLVASNNNVVATVNTLSGSNRVLVQEVKTISSSVKELEKTVLKNTTVASEHETKLKNINVKQNQFEKDIKEVKESLKLLQDASVNSSAPNGTGAAERRRPLQVTGTGDAIGIQRLLHIVVSRIPLGEEFTEQWIKEKIQEKIDSIGASVVSTEMLKSTNPDRQNPRSKSFKVSISYQGKPDDIYKPEFFPTHSKVTRFNFPKRRRVAGDDSNRNGAPQEPRQENK